MASFADCLSHSKINAAYIKRNAVVMDMNSTVGFINQLNRDNPKTRQFLTFEKEAETLLIKVKHENNLFIQLLLSAAPDISSDVSFTQDQNSFRSTTLACINSLDDFRTLLESKNLVPTITEQQATATAAATTSADVASLIQHLSKNLTTLTDLGKKQALTSKQHVEALASSKGPKPTQPHFEPKGDAQDYLNYKNFLNKFEYFVKSVSDKKDKLQWLMSSVQGDVFESIKNFTLDDNNYDAAILKLEKKYLNNDKIQQTIFGLIYHYSNPSPDKLFNNVLKGLTEVENHIIELKNVHQLDCHLGAADKLISQIIFHNLPGQLRNELINCCKSNYPSLQQIFDNIQQVVDKVNLLNGNVPHCPAAQSKSKSGSVTGVSSNGDIENSIGNVSVHLSGYGSKGDSVEERSGSSGVNCFTHSPLLINSGSGVCHRAVALETAVLTVHNEECRFLPIEKRHFSILVDSGAQRSLISLSCARRLNLRVVRRENAGLQGLGQSSCSVIPYDVVEVVVGPPHSGRPVRFDALVVSDLNSICMPGASKFAQKLHSKRIPIADWRFLSRGSDVIISDCLLGDDYSRRIVSPHHLPRYLYGMWLSYTVFGGAMMSGKIPGSTKFAAPKAVNVLSILNVSNASDSMTVPVAIGIRSDSAHSVRAIPQASRKVPNYYPKEVAQCADHSVKAIPHASRMVPKAFPEEVAEDRFVSCKLSNRVTNYQPNSVRSSATQMYIFSTLHLLCFCSMLVYAIFISRVCLRGAPSSYILPALHMHQGCHCPVTCCPVKYHLHHSNGTRFFLWFFIFLHLMKSGFYWLAERFMFASIYLIGAIKDANKILSFSGRKCCASILSALYIPANLIYTLILSIIIHHSLSLINLILLVCIIAIPLVV